MVFRVRLGVCDPDRTALQQRATRRRLSACADWGALPELQQSGRVVVVGGGTAEFAVVSKNHARWNGEGLALIARGLLSDRVRIF
jgi:hypothetical protein